jgi:glycolate oxidase FAD binding subunit
LPSAFEIEPLTVAEAAEALQKASLEGRRVSIERGGGELVVSTRYLNRVLEHEAGDLTVTVEAGIHLSALNERLGGHGQMLALDPPGDPTVGAAVAGDLFGPRAYR